MANPRLGLTTRIKSLLADGEWHYELEIAIHLRDVIPPELAMRRAKQANRAGGKNPVPLPIDVVIRRGVQEMVHNVLRTMYRSKMIERRVIDRTKRQWKLLDADTLAWGIYGRDFVAQGEKKTEEVQPG